VNQNVRIISTDASSEASSTIQIPHCSMASGTLRPIWEPKNGSTRRGRDVPDGPRSSSPYVRDHETSSRCHTPGDGGVLIEVPLRMGLEAHIRREQHR
jgi:hypothetical protein